jgi:polysaccharide export outer membrane protein
MLFASLLLGCAGRTERSTRPANATPNFHTITLIDADTQPATEPALPPSPANGIPPPRYPVPTITTTNLFIYVGGEVKQAGRFNWVDGLTLTNAIATAGGFTDFADISRIDLRRGAGSNERYSYPRIIRGLTNNPTLQPNDQVLVHKRFW